MNISVISFDGDMTLWDFQGRMNDTEIRPDYEISSLIEINTILGLERR